MAHANVTQPLPNKMMRVNLLPCPSCTSLHLSTWAGHQVTLAAQCCRHNCVRGKAKQTNVRRHGPNNRGGNQVKQMWGQVLNTTAMVVKEGAPRGKLEPS